MPRRGREIADAGAPALELNLVLVVGSFSTPVTLMADLGSASQRPFEPAGYPVVASSEDPPIRLARTTTPGDVYLRQWVQVVASGNGFRGTAELQPLRPDGPAPMTPVLQSAWINEHSIRSADQIARSWKGSRWWRTRSAGHGRPLVVASTLQPRATSWSHSRAAARAM